MKIVISIFLSILFIKQGIQEPLCKVEILRSFGYHSLLKPNTQNFLCPKIDFNCCTKHDQMKMHKIWNLNTKLSLLHRYDKAKKQFKKLENFIKIKQEILINDLNQEIFEKIDDLPDEIKIHLNELSKEVDNILTDQLKKDLDDLIKKRQKSLYKFMKSYRKAQLCQLCDFDAQEYIHTESDIMIYNDEICKLFLDNNLEHIQLKYQGIYSAILHFDEWHFLVTNTRLIEDPFVRKTLAQNFQEINKCEGDVITCNHICQQLKFNSVSEMIDGEGDFIEPFLEKFLEFFEDLKSKKFMEEKIGILQDDDLNDFVENDSLLTSSIVIGENEKEPKYFLNLELPHSKNDLIFQQKHDFAPIQISKLQNEIDPSILYSINSEAIDLSEYTILYEEFDGMKYMKHMNTNHFHFRKQLIMAFLNENSADKNRVNEIIEDHIYKMLTDIKIDDYRDFKKQTVIVFIDYKILKKTLDKDSEDEGDVDIPDEPKESEEAEDLDRVI